MLASHATAFSGEPRAAAPDPVATISPFLLEHHAAGLEVKGQRTDGTIAQHEHAAGGVVRHGVGDLDLPVAHARVDDLEAGHDEGGGSQHIGHAHAGPRQVVLEHEGNLALGARLDQRACVDGLALVDDHRIGQHAEIGLMHAQHVQSDEDLIVIHFCEERPPSDRRRS